MYITYGGIGLWHNMLDYICQSLFEMDGLLLADYYNSCHSIRGKRMAAKSEEDTKGEELSLSGSPIWNLQAGEDIFPSPPCDQANTLKKYHLPGDKSVMVASRTCPM